MLQLGKVSEETKSQKVIFEEEGLNQPMAPRVQG